ncbi:MAG: hypothetical protein AABW57_02075 [Nanoarchaeota archaeon]
MKKLELEQHLNELKNRIGLVGGPLRLIYLEESEDNIKAGIRPEDWHTEILVRESWSPTPDKKSKDYAKKKKIKNPLKKVLEDIIYHETGHWELTRDSGYGCPYSIELHSEILDGVTKALKEKKKESDAIVNPLYGQTLKDYVANTLEDVIDNLNCTNHTDFSGQVLFWYDQGLKAKKYGEFYDAFVRLNMELIGSKEDKKLLRRFYNKNPIKRLKVIRAVNDVKNNLALKKKKQENIETLFNKNNWNDIAYKYTLAVADLLDEAPKEKLFGTGETQFSKKLAQPGEIEKIARKRFEAGKSQPSYLTSFEYLDALYRNLAKDIIIKVDEFTREISFPLAPYGNRAFDIEKDDPRKIRLSRASLTSQGNLELQVPRNYIPFKGEFRKPEKNFPNLKIVLLDTSGSMKEHLTNEQGIILNPEAEEEKQWTSTSKYHYALIGFYGIKNYLIRQGIAPYVDSSLINFSDENIASGRKDMDSREINKLALSPQFGGTEINPSVLEKQLQGDAFILSLSDGEIENWSSIKQEYEKIVKDRPYVHIQIGSKNQFTKDLEKANIPVQYVTKGDELAKLMIDLTKSNYSRRKK